MLCIQSFNSVSFYSVPGFIPTVVLWQETTTYNYAGNKAECESKQDQLDEGDDTKHTAVKMKKDTRVTKQERGKIKVNKQVTFIASTLIACLHTRMNTK